MHIITYTVLSHTRKTVEFNRSQSPVSVLKLAGVLCQADEEAELLNLLRTFLMQSHTLPWVMCPSKDASQPHHSPQLEHAGSNIPCSRQLPIITAVILCWEKLLIQSALITGLTNAVGMPDVFYIVKECSLFPNIKIYNQAFL